MSLYNMLFGTNKAAPILLAILEKTDSDFGRFRDAYLNKDGTKIIVYTRCGGGNREDYQYVFDEMKLHTNYITNYDDSFDCTYAYFEFSVPEKYKEELELAAPAIGQDETPTERFEHFIEYLRTQPKTVKP